MGILSRSLPRLSLAGLHPRFCSAAGHRPDSCHRSRPILATASSSPVAAIQTPAICQALARGRRSSSMLSPSPSSCWGIHPRSQERQRAGPASGNRCAVHPIPTACPASPLLTVDSRRPVVHRKGSGASRDPGRAPASSGSDGPGPGHRPDPARGGPAACVKGGEMPGQTKRRRRRLRQPPVPLGSGVPVPCPC